MTRKLLLLLTFLALPACGWAPDTSDSTGVCQGRLGVRTLDGALDLSASQYHRDGDRFVARLSYLGGALEVEGEVPAEFTAGVSEFELGAGRWGLKEPRAGQGRVTVEQTTPYRMLGTLEVEDDQGQRVACSFDLRRAIELETE